jgi:hypothetical protein
VVGDYVEGVTVHHHGHCRVRIVYMRARREVHCGE